MKESKNENAALFADDEVHSELHRILKYKGFKKAPVLSKFLTYVVNETLSNRTSQIKEYTIALHILQRNISLHSNGTSPVRIHALRLRRILQQYYLSDGMTSNIVIEIPKGGYIPVFTSRTKAENRLKNEENLPKPIVAVFPLVPFSESMADDFYSMLIAEDFGAELSSFSDLEVIGYHSIETLKILKNNVLDVAIYLKADFAVSGKYYLTNKRIHIVINLMDVNGKLIFEDAFSEALQKGCNGFGGASTYFSKSAFRFYEKILSFGNARM